jgi:hypothetical protein
MRPLAPAFVVGALVALFTYLFGPALLVFGLVVGVVGLVLCFTLIGAIIGIPLLLLGIVGVVLGAAGTGGLGSALLFGALVGGAVYLVERRRESRALARFDARRSLPS